MATHINLSLKMTDVDEKGAIAKFEKEFDSAISSLNSANKLDNFTSNDKSTLSSDNIREIYNSYDANSKGDDLDFDELKVEVTFKKPIPLNDDIKEVLNKVIIDYMVAYFKVTIGNTAAGSITITDRTIKNMQKITIYNIPEKQSAKKNRNTPNMPYTKNIMWIYTIGINESINKLVKYVKNNDIKNSNKILSSILKEKINSKLDKTLKSKDL
jgi:hypothetical protein